MSFDSRFAVCCRLAPFSEAFDYDMLNFNLSIFRAFIGLTQRGVQLILALTKLPCDFSALLLAAR